MFNLISSLATQPLQTIVDDEIFAAPSKIHLTDRSNLIEKTIWVGKISLQTFSEYHSRISNWATLARHLPGVFPAVESLFSLNGFFAGISSNISTVAFVSDVQELAPTFNYWLNGSAREDIEDKKWGNLVAFAALIPASALVLANALEGAGSKIVLFAGTVANATGIFRFYKNVMPASFTENSFSYGIPSLKPLSTRMSNAFQTIRPYGISLETTTVALFALAFVGFTYQSFADLQAHKQIYNEKDREIIQLRRAQPPVESEEILPRQGLENLEEDNKRSSVGSISPSFIARARDEENSTNEDNSRNVVIELMNEKCLAYEAAKLSEKSMYASGAKLALISAALFGVKNVYLLSAMNLAALLAVGSVGLQQSRLKCVRELAFSKTEIANDEFNEMVSPEAQRTGDSDEEGEVSGSED